MPLSDSEKQIILTEQFWITLTTLTANGFMIATDSLNAWLVILFAFLISLVAIFIIVHRHVIYAQVPICYPKKEDKEELWQRKRKETKTHLRLVPGHFWVVVYEFSGSFFCVLLIFSSLVGVLESKLKFCQAAGRVVSAHWSAVSNFIELYK